MKTPFYRTVFAHSWQLLWRHKILWLFGLFAAFLGHMGLVEFFTRVGVADSSYAFLDAWYWFLSLGDIAAMLLGAGLSAETWAGLLWVLSILIGFGLFFLFASVVSQGALIHAAAQSVQSKRSQPNDEKAWHAGVSHFWRLLGLNVIKRLCVFCLVCFIGAATFNVLATGSGWDMFVFISLFVGSSLVGMILSFLMIYAAGYVVVEEYSFKDSIVAAWRLFTSHWLVSFEIGLILLVFNVFLVFALFLLFLIVFIETTFFWIVFAALGVSPILFSIVSFFLFLCFLVILLFGQALFTVFMTNTWMYMFMGMHKKGIKSRLVHLFHGE